MRELLLITGLLLGASHFAGAETYLLEEMTLSVSHRIYKNYQEVRTVKMGERFYLSDGEYSAEATEFYPDFEINANTKEVISRSSEPNNPAVRVVVYKNDEKVDEVWAFGGGGSPHYYRDSLLAFQLVEFKGMSVAPPGEDDAVPETESGGGVSPPEGSPVEKGAAAEEDSTVDPPAGE